MASAEAAPPDPVKSKVSVLKVSIHCEGCKKKVFRILRKIEGIELMDIDAKQNKVTVKAPVDAQTLIQKFKKSGKHAELWPEQNISTEHIAKKEIKEPSKSDEKKENPQKPATAAASAAAGASPPKEAKTEAAKEGENSTSKEPKKADDGSVENAKPPTESTTATDHAEKVKVPPVDVVDSTAGGEKTPKKALKDSNAHPVLAPQPAYIMSYNTAQPSVMQSHYVSPAMPPAMPASQGYMYADQYFPWAPPPPEYYYYNAVDGHSAASVHHQPAADPYNNNMFSDENPNGCSVM